MYQNIYIEKPQKGKPLVHIWDDKKGYQKFQFTPYAYQKSPTGQHRSLYGDKLKKVQYWTGDDLDIEIYYHKRKHNYSSTNLRQNIGQYYSCKDDILSYNR